MKVDYRNYYADYSRKWKLNELNRLLALAPSASPWGINKRERQIEALREQSLSEHRR